MIADRTSICPELMKQFCNEPRELDTIFAPCPRQFVIKNSLISHWTREETTPEMPQMAQERVSD